MGSNLNMHDHFSRVASYYREVRTTDVEPVTFVGETFKERSPIKAADVGCGAGRYDGLLFKYLKNLHLTCIDINESMLGQLSDYLELRGITDFKTIKADAENIPLEERSMDCVLSFNAIHHFDFTNFIKKAAQVIKKDGKIFIYTRLRTQNARSVWGKHFPLFAKKEKRLYELNEIKRGIQGVGSLSLETVKTFRYKRTATLQNLVEKANARHYSTFSLYDEDEWDNELEGFQENIRNWFQDTKQINWFDENIMLVMKLK